MKEEDLPGNARQRGIQLIAGLRHLQEEFSAIGDVRGLGLMVGVEFRTPENKPDKTTAKAIVHACQDRKMLLLTCGPWDNTIRFIPPLIVNPSQIDEALGIFRDAILDVVR
jgi:4-aminobutyrate aminotransferase